MSFKGKAAVAAAALLTAGTATAQSQKVTGPVADYWVGAATTSGFGGMMGGAGGQRPSAMGAMGMMMRGAANPNAAQHSLTLQLGSTQAPSGSPSAEHLPPQGLGAGQALPLVTPQQARPEPPERPELPREMQRPNGRMLIYWGCGETAGPGQPLVIDFAKISQGQVPNLPAISVKTENPPSPSRARTFGEWPNERTRASVPADGSLVGSHIVKGNYSPPITFDLGPGEDFLAPLTITGQQPAASGATRLTWNPVPRSTGYFAWLMGASGDGRGQGADVVFWTSSQQSSFLGQLMDYIPPAEARRLVAANVVMAPQTTSCVIPAEVAKASPSGLLSMIAFGDEVTRVDPPRPASPNAPWNISWRVKVRYKSTTATLLGMPSMMGETEQPQGRRGAQQQRQQQQQRPSMGGILGGAVRGGLGF